MTVVQCNPGLREGVVENESPPGAATKSGKTATLVLAFCPDAISSISIPPESPLPISAQLLTLGTLTLGDWRKRGLSLLTLHALT